MNGSPATAGGNPPQDPAPAGPETSPAPEANIAPADTSSGAHYRVLKPLSVGIVFGAMTVFLISPFASGIVVPLSAFALLGVGLVVGMALTLPGATFFLGFGVFSVLMMGTGYQLGDIFGYTGAWVGGMFGLSLLMSLSLPHLPTFQRAILAALVTGQFGIMGMVLGASVGYPVLACLGFLSVGTFVSIAASENRTFPLASNSMLALFTMGAGYTVAFFAGQQYFWVPLFFGVSLIITFFFRATTARLVMLLLAIINLFVAFGYGLGAAFNLAYITVPALLVMGLLVLLVVYFSSDTMILSANGGKVAGEGEYPREYGMLKRISARAGIQYPRLAIVSSEAANLFTVGRSPGRAVIAVTRGLLNRTTDEELEPLLAHEIFHIKEKDLLPATIASAIAFPVGKAAQTMVAGKDREVNPLVVAVVGIAAPFVALLMHLSMPRSREKRADEGAASWTVSPACLANVVERLDKEAGQYILEANPATEPLFAVNPFRGGWIVALFTTHPTAEERGDNLRKSLDPKTAGG